MNEVTQSPYQDAIGNVLLSHTSERFLPNAKTSPTLNPTTPAMRDEGVKEYRPEESGICWVPSGVGPRSGDDRQ
jgi:hypothetical protein